MTSPPCRPRSRPPALALVTAATGGSVQQPASRTKTLRPSPESCVFEAAVRRWTCSRTLLCAPESKTLSELEAIQSSSIDAHPRPRVPRVRPSQIARFRFAPRPQGGALAVAPPDVVDAPCSPEPPEEAPETRWTGAKRPPRPAAGSADLGIAREHEEPSNTRWAGQLCGRDSGESSASPRRAGIIASCG